METIFPRYMGGMEKLVAGPYATGEELTIADLQLYSFVRFFRSGMLDGIPKDCVNASTFPKVDAVCAKVGEHPAIKAWNEAHNIAHY